MAVLKRGVKLRKYAERVQAAAADATSHIAQEIYRKNVELAHTNQTLSLLRTIDGLVLEPENTLDDLAKGIAAALVENSNYLFSAVFINSMHEIQGPMVVGGLGTANIEGVSKPDDTAITAARLYPAHEWFKSKDYSKIFDVNENEDDFLASTFKNQSGAVTTFAKDCGCKSICIVKLLARRKIVGALMIGLSTAAESLAVNEIEFMGRIGEASGIALDNKILFEENQQVLKKLQQSNKKLKALDEAKDEFISMASHQLRTPLTSVKGYVSMVLEGDAGKLSDQQKKLLTQAFTSSQRMVYLIADLLNVSRMHTGKFVIDLAPTNLPEVIEGELQQLTETAKAHSLELTFDKPDSFPILNLDETKTRQVIMNFMDNAIYYTPAGGHIHVQLTASENSVEFKVVDDGLGVPKAEQHHLFTKFYRAGNAKKARPDGTGLGLFMAQKVIIAEGGSIIFNSEEGKGSTFGFSFPRVTLEVKSK